MNELLSHATTPPMKAPGGAGVAGEDGDADSNTAADAAATDDAEVADADAATTDAAWAEAAAAIMAALRPMEVDGSHVSIISWALEQENVPVGPRAEMPSGGNAGADEPQPENSGVSSIARQLRA
jgi:hypothetical protein